MLLNTPVHSTGRLAGGIIAITLGLLLWGAVAGVAQESQPDSTEDTIKVALFVDNRAGSSYDKEVSVLEDFIASRLSNAGMQVLSREVILNSLRDFSADSTSTTDTPGQEMDRLLSDSTSALRLAQNLDADYVLLASIASYGTESRSFSGQNVKTVNEIYRLRVSYRLAEAARGGEVSGDTVLATRTFRLSDGLQVESSDVLNSLLDEAARKVTASLASKRPSLPAVAKDESQVQVTFRCTITDFAALPNAGLNENNEVVLGEGHADATISDVTVEVNGIAIGSTPGPLEVQPGLNKLRLTREGFKPYERTVNFYNGQTLTVALQMSEAGYARWKDVVATYTALENNRKLTDAEVEVLRGYAQMLRQSGIKVDTKEGLKFYRGVYW
jgi:hypothetical protein